MFNSLPWEHWKMWVSRWSLRTTRGTGLTPSPIARPEAGETEYRRTEGGRQTTEGSLLAQNSSNFTSQLITKNIFKLYLWLVAKFQPKHRNLNFCNHTAYFVSTNEVSLKSYNWIVNCVTVKKLEKKKEDILANLFMAKENDKTWPTVSQTVN